MDTTGPLTVDIGDISTRREEIMPCTHSDVGLFIHKEETMNQQVAVPTKHFTQWMQESINLLYKGITQQALRLVLANGVSLSIQASEYHYCTPRETVPYSKYTEFEVGYPSEEIGALMPYCDDCENPTKTIYGYVPLEVLDAYIASVGGVTGYAINIPLAKSESGDLIGLPKPE